MGLNKKVSLSVGAVVALLAVVGFKAYRKYERSDDKRELDKIQAENAQDSADRMRRLQELRDKIGTIKTGLKACDTLMGMQRTPPKCRDAKTPGEIRKMIEKTMLTETTSAAALEESCKATLDQIIELSVDRGCQLE